MSKKSVTTAALVAGAMSAAIGMSMSVQPAHAAKIKCYGVAKAGKNGCAAGPGTTCAGTSKIDYQSNAWSYENAASCDAIKVMINGKEVMGTTEANDSNIPS